MLYDDQTSSLFAQNLGKSTRLFVKIPSFTLIPTAIWLSFILTDAVTSFAQTTYDLNQPPALGRAQRVLVALEVRGELKLNADGSKVSQVPMSVEGNLDYDEKLVDAQPDPWSRRSVRHYHQAKASIKIGKGVVTPQFGSDDRIICVRVDEDGSSIRSPFGPLAREHLDLIDVQGNSLLLPSLLPTEPVKIDDHWEIEGSKLASLVGLDVITQSDVRCSLVNVEGEVALIEVSGTIDGAVGGVASEIKLKAKCNYDISRRLITWFAATIREKRAIGHAEPGFDVAARLRVAVTPIDASEHLGDAQLAALPLDEQPGNGLVSFRAQRSYFRLIHDRRWRSMLDRYDLCVFRFVDRGDLVAQCNISELPELEPGKQLSLEELQADVQRSLGDNFGQIVEATKWTTDDGKRVLRVVASGLASEISIQWIYYHVSNDKGRRAALAITLESKLMERFAESDRTLVETFEFLPRPQPTEAKKTTTEKTRS